MAHRRPALKPNERLLYVAQLLLHYSDGMLQRTNLLKGLFYLDLSWLRDKGATFTGAQYVALEHGPVIDDYRYVLLAPLVERKVAREEEVPLGYGGKTAKRVHLNIAPNVPDDLELDIACRTAARIASGALAVELSDFTHDNVGWRNAIRAGQGTPIDMHLALSQLLDDGDPWLDEELTEDEQKLLDKRRGGEFISF